MKVFRNAGTMVNLENVRRVDCFPGNTNTPYRVDVIYFDNELESIYCGTGRNNGQENMEIIFNRICDIIEENK